jgi:hypothetical protein
MNEYAANKWFCVDSNIGRDIQADSPRRRYHIMGTPHRHLRTYRQRCSAWRNEWKIEGWGGRDGEIEDDFDEEESDQVSSNSTMNIRPTD